MEGRSVFQDVSRRVERRGRARASAHRACAMSGPASAIFEPYHESGPRAQARGPLYHWVYCPRIFFSISTALVFAGLISSDFS